MNVTGKQVEASSQKRLGKWCPCMSLCVCAKEVDIFFSGLKCLGNFLLRHLFLHLCTDAPPRLCRFSLTCPPASGMPKQHSLAAVSSHVWLCPGFMARPVETLSLRHSCRQRDLEGAECSLEQSSMDGSVLPFLSLTWFRHPWVGLFPLRCLCLPFAVSLSAPALICCVTVPDPHFCFLDSCLQINYQHSVRTNPRFWSSGSQAFAVSA